LFKPSGTMKVCVFYSLFCFFFIELFYHRIIELTEVPALLLTFLFLP
jgi:hypothetical protein